MRYRIACVGRPDGGPFGTAVAHVSKRLAALAATELTTVKEGKGRDPDARRQREAEGLRAAIVGRSVALDERGRAFTTLALAEHVAGLDLRGESRLTLLVGGADGLDERLRAEVDETWRLSDLTLAHELALTVLIEQLYRIEAVRAGHPYHRGD